MFVKNKSKSFLSLVISLAIIMLAFAVPINTQISASAETVPTPPEGITVWDGTTSEVTPESSTYNVSTAEELAWVLSIAHENKTIELQNDIYLNNLDNFESWSETAPTNQWSANDTIDKTLHNVVIEGNNHMIYGLYDYNSEGNAGLVHTTKGNWAASGLTFKNLGIDYAYIYGKYSSAFFARLADDSNTYPITFENCFVGENVTII